LVVIKKFIGILIGCAFLAGCTGWMQTLDEDSFAENAAWGKDEPWGNDSGWGKDEPWNTDDSWGSDDSWGDSGGWPRDEPWDTDDSWGSSDSRGADSRWARDDSFPAGGGTPAAQTAQTGTREQGSAGEQPGSEAAGAASSQTQAAEQQGGQPAQAAGQQGSQPAQAAEQQGGQPAQTAEQQSAQAAAAQAAAQAAGSPVPAPLFGDWRLIEVRRGEEVSPVNRQKLESEGFGDLFTLSLANNNRIDGKAAPNLFTSPFLAGQGGALTIQPELITDIRIYYPEYIREKDYFTYLTKVKQYKITANRLELTSTDERGRNIVLIYSK
jgi:biotin carboxyl carrier protein